MKTNKRAVFFLFLCMMGALMLTMTSSQSLLPNDSIVYAEEGDEEEEEEIEENAPAPVTNSNGNYGNLQIPAMLSTAYADGLRQAQQSNDDSDADTFTSNVHAVMTFDSYFDKDGDYHSEEGRFDTLGVLIGPVGQSSGSGTNDVASTLSVGLDELKNNYSFDQNLGEAYWTFGRAAQNLRLDAERSDTSTIGASSAINAFSGISRHVTNIGVQLLKNWSPAPIVLAFTDHTILRDPQYVNNRLVQTVGNVEALTTLINAFGSPVPMYPRISYSQLIMIVMIMLGLAVSILTIFMGKSFFPVSMKKTLVKVLIMIVAVPLTMRVYDWGLEKLDEVTNDEVYTTEYQLARHHLLLGMWAEKGFALPTDMALTVSDGRFVLSREDIRKINGMVLDTDDNAVIADEIRRQVNSDNNESHISWQAVLTETDGEVSGTLWRTNTVLEMATALGNNEPIDVPNTGYVYSSGLRSHRDAHGHFVYTQSGRYGRISEYTRYGLGPVSTYNLLNTTFNGNGLSVKSNLSTGTTVPSVAPTAYAYTGATVGTATPDSEDVNMSGILKWFVEFSLLVASIKALAKIISFGFGGMIHGGARSMFGSSAGWGELLGAIFATIFGVMGLSFFSLVTFEVANSLYGMMRGMIDSIIQDSTVLTIISKWIGTLVSPKGIFGLLPFVSDPIAAWAEEGVVSIVATILALFLLPKFIRIPIEAFAGWVSTLPSAWADKAQRIENRFTGDTLGGSTSSGALAGAMQKAEEGMVNSGRAVAAGGGMLVGAGIKAGGGAIKNKAEKILGKKKDGAGGKDDGGDNESIAATAGGILGGGADDPKTDENGNPITENITDNEGSTDDTQIADETNEEGEVNAEESAEVSENNTEGDMTGDNVNGEEAMISDENSNMTEADAVSDNINAGDDAIADDISDIGAGYGVDAEGNLVNGDGEAITDSDGNNIQPKLNEDGKLDSASANSNGHMLNDSGDVARDADGNPIPIFDGPGDESIAKDISDIGAGYGVDAEGNLVNGDGEAITGPDGEGIKPKLNEDGQLDPSSASDSGHMLNDSGDVAYDAQGNPIPLFQPNDQTDNDNPTDAGVATAGNITEGSINEGELSQDVSVNDEYAQGDVNADESSSHTDSRANTSTATDGTSSNQSSLNVGGTSSESIASGGISSNESNINSNATNTNNSASGGEVNTSEASSGDSIASSGDDVNTSQATSGGDVNSSQVNAGSEAGGTTGTTESGVHSDSHSESTMGGQTSESGQVSGATVSNDSTMEGSQVTHDASQNNANVTTDSNAQVNQSSEERTTNQGDNADNSQRADVKSNAQTVNDNQSRNTSIGGSQGSPATGSPRVSADGGQSSAKPASQGGQSSAKPASQGGQSSAKPASQGGTKVVSKPSAGGGQTGAKPSSSGTQTGAKPQPNSGSKPTPNSGAKVSATGGPKATPNSGAKVSATGGTRTASSSNNRRPNLSSIVGGRNAGGQTRKPMATISKGGSVASNSPRQSAGQGAQNTQRPSRNENTSQKASRISDKIGRGSAQQGGVSNAQQAAMGAVHMLGGLTGMEGITQQGVNSLHRKQGRKVNSKETSKTPNQSQNPTQSKRDREQQIIDIERRKEEEQSKRVKKPSFITQARNKGKNNKR